MTPKTRVRDVVKTAVTVAATAYAIGAAQRAASGGVSGEVDVERREETPVRSPEMRGEEREQLSATPEEKIRGKLSQVGEKDREKVDSLVNKYEVALARFESEKASGRVSETTLTELRALPDQIREAVNLSRSELDSLKIDVTKNIAARAMRRPAVVREHETEYDVEPNLVQRIGNILLGTPSRIEHVRHVDATVVVPDTLPTLEQLEQEHALALVGRELSEVEDRFKPLVLHPEGSHAGKRKGVT